MCLLYAYNISFRGKGFFPLRDLLKGLLNTLAFREIMLGDMGV